MTNHAAHKDDGSYYNYDVAKLWDRVSGLTIRRLQRQSGIVAIPALLPGYRVALSLAQNNASLEISGCAATKGSFVEGMMVLGQPGEIFDGEMRNRVDVLLVLMEPEFVANRIEGLGLSANGVELRNLPPRQDVGLLDATRRLTRAFDRGLAGDELYCDVLIDAIVMRIIALHATAPIDKLPYRETLSPRRLRMLIDFIEENLDAPLRLEDLASTAALSRAHLARAFRAATGLSPHRYVLQRRLEKAHTLLNKSASPLREIAACCGFSDAAHLSKAYKRNFGALPSSRNYGCSAHSSS
jgi:AraC family transcriptional regulator